MKTNFYFSIFPSILWIGYLNAAGYNLEINLSKLYLIIHFLKFSANQCLSRPCLNSGSCYSFNSISYYCDCPTNYDGVNCEECNLFFFLF